MQPTSELYQQLYREIGTVKEHRAVIAGEVYGEDRLVSCETTGNLFSQNTLSVGGTYAGQITLSLRSPGAIPRMAKMEIYCRLVNGSRVSEWIPDGVYYIDTRSTDPQSGVLTLNGYDAMLKAEQIYLPEGEVGEWPRPMPTVVEDICARMGVKLDSRTVLDPSYLVEYPNDYTMREILGYVAAAHGGNWIITPVGELRLVTLAERPEETNLLCDENGDVLMFGEVAILV